MKWSIVNARAVLPDRVLSNGTVRIEDGIIASAGEGPAGGEPAVDLDGQYLLPGFVDPHSDAIEKDAEPRPNVHLPLERAVDGAARRNAAHGVTTVFHGVSFGHETRGLRSTPLAARLVQTLAGFRGDGIIDNRILLRYEISSSNAFPVCLELIRNGMADLVSVMDHTPKAALYADVEEAARREGLISGGNGNAGRLEGARLEAAARALERMKTLAETCREHGVPIGSHDDSSRARIALIQNLGMTLSEFPTNLDAARAAREAGIHAILGAPNVARGGSHLNWVDAAEAARHGLARCLCSDYHPAILPLALYTLVKNRVMRWHEAARLVSLNPALAAGLTDRGSIEPGKRADLCALAVSGGVPVVTRCWVAGRAVYRRRLPSVETGAATPA